MPKFRRTVDILLTMKKMNSFLTACEEVLLMDAKL